MYIHVYTSHEKIALVMLFQSQAQLLLILNCLLHHNYLLLNNDKPIVYCELHIRVFYIMFIILGFVMS